MLILCILVITMIKSVFTFANLLVKDCEVKLEQNVEIMGSPVTLSTEREIQLFPIGVHDESQSIRNGTHLLPQKQYVVKLIPKINQCMFQVTGGAHFDKGNSCTDSSSRSLCEGSRGAILTIDVDSPEREVHISAGWSKTFQAGVSKTDFILYLQEPTSQDL